MAGFRFAALVASICVCAFSFEVSASVGSGATRKLLQSMGSCGTDFTTMDYTPITSKCAAPYPQAACCQAYSDFCAPYKSQLNDLSNVCAITMLSYLNKAGNYENGVFMGRCNSGSNVCN